VPGRERLGPDLVHIVAARWLAAHDIAGSVEGVGVVDPFAALADSEYCESAW
jgi:hypothetical protein